MRKILKDASKIHKSQKCLAESYAVNHLSILYAGLLITQFPQML